MYWCVPCVCAFDGFRLKQTLLILAPECMKPLRNQFLSSTDICCPLICPLIVFGHAMVKSKLLKAENFRDLVPVPPKVIVKADTHVKKPQPKLLKSASLVTRPLVVNPKASLSSVGSSVRREGCLPLLGPPRGLDRNNKAIRAAWQRKNLEKVRRKLGEATLGQGSLGDLSVTPEVLKDYCRRLSELWAYLAEHNMSFTTPVEKDEGLTSFANELFVQGELAGEGQKLRAAFEALEPDLSRHGTLGLPRLRRALQGWERVAPNQRTVGTPEVILDAGLEDMLDRNRSDIALCCQLSYSCLLRPSEAMNLCMSDVTMMPHPLSLEGSKATLTLAPFERGIWTKTKSFDESVVVQDSRTPWLPEVLARCHAMRSRALLRRGISDVGAAPLWEFASAEILACFQETGARLLVPHLFRSRYQLRHGGATRDALLKTRSLAEIMRLGRWGHLESVRHYEKQGRSTQILSGSRRKRPELF